MSNSTTERMYAAAETDFRLWMTDTGHRMPVPHREVAGYLRQVYRERGASSVPVYLSALGRLYRSRGDALDTRATPIQDVVRDARAEMATTRARR